MMNTSLLQKSGLQRCKSRRSWQGWNRGDRIPTVTELRNNARWHGEIIQIALNNLKQNHVNLSGIPWAERQPLQQRSTSGNGAVLQQYGV